ncbi:O-antigen ligase family protein [Candidatus Enterococcus ikei]|uniref:O-antigen ligase family protein n=1 Tax=Candidatus Enterococcus ikei TaxID=2815326 RepID=A0ABS3GYP7_9ENTE|nr:O-antigen ligase family protein [Enterococcus sp. DIV0869a]MBO0440377.1 O-antigen ligase family protein [Enterococcus sp. DIV0869a]
MKNEINNYKLKNYEMFLIVFFIALTYLSINIKIFVGILSIIILLVRNRFRLPYDTIYFPIFLVLIAGSIAGIVNQQLIYNFLRDFSYFIGPIVYIILGSFLYTELKYKPSIFRLFVIYIAMDTVKVFLNIFLFQRELLVSGSFNVIRSAILGGETVVPLALGVLVFKSYFKDAVLFSKKVNTFLVVILSIRLILSFSRTMIISFLVTGFIFLFFRPEKKSIKPKQVALLIAIIIVFFITIRFLPDKIINTLVNKFQRIFVETSSIGNWSNYETVVNNWRGYEVSVGKQLYYSGTILQKIFGFGFGQLFPVMYSDLVGVPLSDGGITIIHNGYLFNLIKGGIFSLAMYILFFLLIMIKSLKDKIENSIVSPLLFAYSMLMTITTAVIMGFFQRNFDAGMILIFSMALAYQRMIQKEKK